MFLKLRLIKIGSGSRILNWRPPVQGEPFPVQVCMRRCSGCICQKVWQDIFLLFFLTFGIVLPCLSFKLRHTIYDHFIEKNKTREKMKLMKDNTERLDKASAYLKYLDETGSFKKFNLNFERNYFQSVKSFQRKTTSLAVTVITVSRNRHTILDYEPKYLTQTLAEFLRLINASRFDSTNFQIGLFVCNVDSQPDSYAEVKNLPSWFKVFQRFPQNSMVLSDMGFNARIEKEKQDYVYCLEQSLAQNVSHVLLVEDDALPHPDLFPVIDRFVLSNFGHAVTSSSNITYFKLYHPERLLGYISIEYERLPELFSLSFLFSIILLRMYTKLESRKFSLYFLWIIFFIYSGLTFLALGRVNVIEFRRISKYLYQLTPAPSCCTPAMLFPRQGGRNVADYLNSVTCRSNFAKDTALDTFRRKTGLTARMIQPNLFKHIGQFSSLRPELVNPFIV